MFEPRSFTDAALQLATCLVVLYALRRYLLPRPLPGIPHNKDAAKSIWGDVPALLKYNSQTREVNAWVMSQMRRHNSSIVQIFVRPFSKPWILLSDFQESRDILMRRTRTFDRSATFGDLFAGTIPDHHIVMKSADSRFKRNRALLKDLMTPAFLHDVVAPSIYSTVESLLELWRQKMELAQDRPFAAAEDISRAALDAILAATFPLKPQGHFNVQAEYLSSCSSFLPADVEDPVTFPKRRAPDYVEAIGILTEALEIASKAPFPRLAHSLVRQTPWWRRANKFKESLLEEQISAGVQRLEHYTRSTPQVCALDGVLRQEYSLAQKENRAPDYHSRMIKDELFGILIAGHDTTSTYLMWAVKILSDDARVQDKLRLHLRQNLSAATQAQRTPTADEITKAQLPYLNAIIEENMRTAKGVAGIVRITLEDTIVLGHVIPKGYEVAMLSNGPGFLEPSIAIDEKSRSATSRTGRRVASWDDADIDKFLPERWLKAGEDGAEVYDATAGPMLSFGLGPRGCYGRRLAYLEMRLVITLLVWTFELRSCKEGLSSYKGVDKVLHKPEQCYVRLQPAVW